MDEQEDYDVQCLCCFRRSDETFSPCNHVMCRRCADKWFSKNPPSCPMCRQDVISLHHEKYEVSHVIKNAKMAGITFAKRTLDHGNGVLVHSVKKDYPAYRVGLRPGDVVLRINGIKMTNYQWASDFITFLLKGDTEVHITVDRASGCCHQ